MKWTKRNDEEWKRFSNYMDAISAAALVNCGYEGGLYYGVEGAKRLGRECGVALADFDLDPREMIGSTYGGICVRAYWLRPPINNDVWVTSIQEGYNREIESRKNRRKENETQLQEA